MAESCEPRTVCYLTPGGYALPVDPIGPEHCREPLYEAWTRGTSEPLEEMTEWMKDHLHSLEMIGEMRQFGTGFAIWFKIKCDIERVMFALRWNVDQILP